MIPLNRSSVQHIDHRLSVMVPLLAVDAGQTMRSASLENARSLTTRYIPKGKSLLLSLHYKISHLAVQIC